MQQQQLGGCVASCQHRQAWTNALSPLYNKTGHKARRVGGSDCSFQRQRKRSWALLTCYSKGPFKVGSMFFTGLKDVFKCSRCPSPSSVFSSIISRKRKIHWPLQIKLLPSGLFRNKRGHHVVANMCLDTGMPPLCYLSYCNSFLERFYFNLIVQSRNFLNKNKETSNNSLWVQSSQETVFFSALL